MGNYHFRLDEGFPFLAATVLSEIVYEVRSFDGDIRQTIRYVEDVSVAFQ